MQWKLYPAFLIWKTNQGFMQDFHLRLMHAKGACAHWCTHFFVGFNKILDVFVSFYVHTHN